MVICCDKSNLPFNRLARNTIQIFSITEIANGVTGFTTTETAIATVKAIIEPKSGLEPFLYGQLTSKVKAHITIRYISDLSNTADGAKYYVKFGDRKYNVLAVMNLDSLQMGNSRTNIIEGTKFQRLICTENEVT